MGDLIDEQIKERFDRSAYRRGGARAMGFASMSIEQNRALNGKRAQALGKAYAWTSETAREAGRKGGSRSKRRKERKRE